MKTNEDSQIEIANALQFHPDAQNALPAAQLRIDELQKRLIEAHAVTELVTKENEELKEYNGKLLSCVHDLDTDRTEKIRELHQANEAKERAETNAAQLTNALLAWENREAAVCSEDRSLEETITQLRADKEKAEQELSRLSIGVPQLVAYGTKLRAELKEARELLESLEWAGWDCYAERNECYFCGESQIKGKHSADCKLQSFLDKSK